MNLNEYNECVIDRYKDNVRATIPTSWPIINEVSDGGFGKGELVVFVAHAVRDLTIPHNKT